MGVTKGIVITFLLTLIGTATFANADEKDLRYKQGVKPTPAPQPETVKSPLTGIFTLTTNYMFRGISQTNNLPAVQGGYTYTFSSGIYLSAWASNVNFYDFYGKKATFELDTTVGITNAIWDQFTYNLSILRYNYPRTNISFVETNLILTYHFIIAQIAYSGDVYHTHASGIYYNLGFKYELPAWLVCQCTGITISAGMGHFSLPRSKGLRSYNDYNIQLAKTIDKFTLALLATDTNRRSIDPKKLKDLHIVGALTYNL